MNNLIKYLCISSELLKNLNFNSSNFVACEHRLLFPCRDLNARCHSLNVTTSMEKLNFFSRPCIAMLHQFLIARIIKKLVQSFSRVSLVGKEGPSLFTDESVIRSPNYSSGECG